MLTNEVIKAQFKEFFSSERFRDRTFTDWLYNPTPSGVAKLARMLKLPKGTSYTDAMVVLEQRYAKPESWTNAKKERMGKCAGWVLVSIGNLEYDRAHVVNEELLRKNAGDPECNMRVFILKPPLRASTECVDITVITDPADEHILGWYMTED